MVILRTAFWLAVIIMLLPIGGETYSDGAKLRPEAQVSTGEVVDAALSTARDVTGLCARQPEVCSIGAEIWQTFERKAVYAAGMVYGWLSEAYATTGREEGADAGPPPKSDRMDDPSNTLTESDLLPAWKGPPRGASS